LEKSEENTNAFGLNSFQKAVQTSAKSSQGTGKKEVEMVQLSFAVDWT
jgi:hypothetical protein